MCYIIYSMEGLSSPRYLLWNNTLGLVVSESAADEVIPVASLTKIMTALVTLEQRQLEEKVLITSEMLQGLEEFAKVGLRVGQEVTIEDLLYATLLPSAGDAAQALAISTAGSIAEFADLMNARAEEIGLENTHFSNPVGMDEDNYSTVRDVAKLLQEALKNPDFVQMFETFERELPSMGLTVKKTFNPVKYIKGGKTGFTNDAGRCLASTAEVEGAEYILVTTGAELGKNVTDAVKVYSAVETEYEPMRLADEGEWLVRIPVKGSPVEIMEIRADQEIRAALQNETKASDLTYVYEGEQEITSGTEVGTKLGSWQVYDGEQLLVAEELYYETAPEFYNYSWMILGWAVSLVALLVAGVAGWKWWHARRKQTKKVSKIVILVALVVLGLSVVLNLVWLNNWSGKTGELEVNRPELEVVEDLKSPTDDAEQPSQSEEKPDEKTEEEKLTVSQPTQTLGNCTMALGNLMLINPNFRVGQDFINNRRGQLISVSQTYGIPEYNRATNGDNLLTAEAAQHLAQMLQAYEEAYPGHKMGTRSCFRAKGTSCGRLCAATGTSDHHTGLTCDLIDTAYGASLDTDDYGRHVEWQWLKANSYKYGFIDRFPEAWAGGSMSEPLNVDANGSTGLFETWHYRYVGVAAATDIATGKYNNGKYDSLEHYLKATGKVADLKAGVCAF